MQHATTPTLIAALSALTACGDSTKSADPASISVEPPAAAITEPCDEARMLPEGWLTQEQVERLWRADRAAMRDCRRRHERLVAWARGAQEAF